MARPREVAGDCGDGEQEAGYQAHLGTIGRLSRSVDARPLPPIDGEPGAVSYYMREDAPELRLVTSEGIAGDRRLSPSHLTRARDILFVDPETLRQIRGDQVDDAGDTKDSDDATMVGQNVTLNEGARIAEWCVGDEIRVGRTAVVRLTSCRRPCPKNDNAHGAGACQRMHEGALGGVFGTVIEGGVVRVGDSISLLRRISPRWTCVGVHLALYGSTPEISPAVLREIARLPHLEGPRYRDVALRRAQQAEKSDPSPWMDFLSTRAARSVILLAACALGWTLGGRAGS